MKGSSSSQSGYVALLAVLIIGAASMAIALALLITGIDSQRAVLVTQQSAQARNFATACTEEALQRIHDNTAFTGNTNLILTGGSCTYTISSTGANTRTIDASSTVNGVARKIKVYVTINASSISITSWQEVS